jgi:hypothetical protein
MLSDFLNNNPLAKIVITLVSHSTQDGEIITHTDVDGTISTDELGPVRSMNYPLVCAN